MLFDTWSGLLRVLVVGTLAYIALVLLLRVSGKRTLAKLNAFDLVVTVALGSTPATVLLSKSMALVEGVAGFALLVALQYMVAWLSVRLPRVSDLVKSEPTLLLHHGRFLEAAMRAHRVNRGEILAALRSAGAADPAQVSAWKRDPVLECAPGAGQGGEPELTWVRGFWKDGSHGEASIPQCRVHAAGGPGVPGRRDPARACEGLRTASTCRAT